MAQGWQSCAQGSTLHDRTGARFTNPSMTILPPTQRNLELRRRLRALAPLIPLADSEPVLARAAKLMRDDLTMGAALWLAMVAHVRHRHTAYDELLAEGYDRDAARHFVVEETDETLRRWGCTKQIDIDATD
jgi:hypothetical protein